MRRSFALIAALTLIVSACAPAAAPTQAPAAAQPTRAPAPTQAPAAVMPAQPLPTSEPTNAPAEVRPPSSGGVLNPPTLIPTAIGSRPNADRWLTYRDPVYGFVFQYPPDWQLAAKTNAPKDVAQRLSVSRLNQSAGNNAEILIDIRRSSGDLLKWLKSELPKGNLLIEARSIEGGLSKLTGNNARLGAAAAIFVFAPLHSATPGRAALCVADKQYFYQFTYLGDIPDNKDTRTVYLQLLASLTLSGTTTTNLALPQTAFIVTR